MLRHEQDVVEGERRRQPDRDLVGVEYVRAGVRVHSAATCKKGRQCGRPRTRRATGALGVPGDAPRSLSGTMTFLVFLSTAAGAGIVASHLRLVAPDLPHDIVAAAARGPWRLGGRRCAAARPDRAER